jgi:hypothetical protein
LKYGSNDQAGVPERYYGVSSAARLEPGRSLP